MINITTHVRYIWLQPARGHVNGGDSRWRQKTVHRVGPRLPVNRVVLRNKMLRADDVFPQLVRRGVYIDVQGCQP